MHNELTDSIGNLWPQPEEAATLSAGNWPPGGKLVEDYALITHMPGPGLRGDIVGLCRSGHFGNRSRSPVTGTFMIWKDRWKYLYFTGYAPALFDLGGDPGELNDLAGRPETAAIQKELHSELLRLVSNPDAITERAFAVQQGLLNDMVRAKTRQQFYDAFQSRLGRRPGARAGKSGISGPKRLRLPGFWVSKAKSHKACFGTRNLGE